MPPTHSPYPAKLKRQMVGLVRAGRNPAELTIFEYIEGWYNLHRGLQSLTTRRWPTKHVP